MACSFSYIENACGCLIGYNIPLLEVDNTPITAYPVHVIAFGGADLGEATTPSAVVALWNADSGSVAKGILSVGTGAFCFALSYISGVTPPSKIVATAEVVTPTTYDWDYGYTALDTTGSPPTEANYITSVDTVYTAAGEVHGTPIAIGDPVSVTSFGNSTDKVLFMQIDPAVAAFTLWSVVGDSLQQNQPIDATFGTGSNVWFKSTRAGETIYLTRSQTSFSGAVVFSR